MRSIRRLCALGILLAIAAIATPADAGKRAFVVGVDNYKAGLPVLNTANRDAASIAGSLADLGFKIDLIKDPDRAEFDRRWLEFRSSLAEGDVAAVYFAGHGIQILGTNYLLPADTPRRQSPEEVLPVAINFNGIMEELEARKLNATIYILDACRTNPFAQAGAVSDPNAIGQSKGLARMESVFGAFVMYSAGPDEEALDGLHAGDQNSLFASRLIPLLGQPQLSLVDLAKHVQVDVEADARGVGHRQRPAYFDGILGQYYLAEIDQKAVPAGSDERVASSNVIRLGGFATWDDKCKGRPAPRISVSSPPKFGRILTRFEDVTIGGTHFGKGCEKTVMRGIGVYYVMDDRSGGGREIETIQFDINHWSVAPVTKVAETFEIDLATRLSKRLLTSSAATSAPAR